MIISSFSHQISKILSLYGWYESQNCQKGNIRECPLFHVSILFLGSVSFPGFYTKQKESKLKENTFSCWIQENASPFFPQIQILNPEWQSHFPKEKLLKKEKTSGPNPGNDDLQGTFSFIGKWISHCVRGSKFEEKRGNVFLHPTTNCCFL